MNDAKYIGCASGNDLCRGSGFARESGAGSHSRNESRDDSPVYL